MLPEAWELVEHGHATEADFRSLTFENPISLWAGMNPAFFDGTTVAEAVARELGRVARVAPPDRRSAGHAPPAHTASVSNSTRTMAAMIRRYQPKIWRPWWRR